MPKIKVADKKLDQREPREELDVGGQKQDTYDEYFSDSLDVNVTPEPDIMFGMPFIRKGDDSMPSDIRALEIKKGGNVRIPRKPGQPAGSKKHSDLYTDENPKGTIHGLKFATESDARKSVAKIKASGKPHAHKIQAAIAMEQRAGVMGKASSAGVYRNYIDSIKKSKKAQGGMIIGKGKDYIKDLL